ncbi:MAG: protein kinase [Sandaracinaceae bacterium]
MDAHPHVCPKCGRQYDRGATFCQQDGTRLKSTAEPDDPYIGQRLLDQFEIVEKVGAGGMGTVYRARQTTLARDVAIKILHRELADNPDAVRRFKREARVSTALDHPNVVRVFLFGQLPDGSLYIVMEFLQGRTLLDLLHAEGALPVHRALHLATQVCDGVGEAHAQGIVHRDIKPENVVIVGRKRDPDFIKVLDFGIARLLWGDEQTMATQTGLVFGTARYISPEGAAGEPTDARSDVYSLGVLTYQLLSGETPFDAPSPVAMLMKHLHSEVPHLLTRERARRVPETVADVVMQGLAKSPGQRFADAHAFGDALRAAAERSGYQVHARGRIASITPPAPAGQVGVADGVPAASSSYGSLPPVPPPRRRRGTPTPVMGQPRPRAASTLADAPSPYHDDTSIRGVAVARRRERLALLRPAAVAFVLGAVLVGGAFGLNRLLAPEPHAAAPPTERVAGGDDGAEADRTDEAPPAEDDVARAGPDVPEEPEAEALHAGLRTEPARVVEDVRVRLVAVVPAELVVGPGAVPRFLIYRRGRRVGSPRTATAAGARVYEANATFRRPGAHELVFQQEQAGELYEQRLSLRVARDRSRPANNDPDPPPVTIQGSAPLIAPARIETGLDPLAPTGAEPVSATEPPDTDEPPSTTVSPGSSPPPPPPAPWTSGGML